MQLNQDFGVEIYIFVITYSYYIFLCWNWKIINSVFCKQKCTLEHQNLSSSALKKNEYIELPKNEKKSAILKSRGFSGALNKYFVNNPFFTIFHAFWRPFWIISWIYYIIKCLNNKVRFLVHKNVYFNTKILILLHLKRK